jgi:hypothetical protein
MPAQFRRADQSPGDAMEAEARREEESGTDAVTQEPTLDGRLTAFIADLKADPIHGSKVVVSSTIRGPRRDAIAVLNNQKKDAGYYKIFSANWRTAILNAVAGRDLKAADQFELAVNSLAGWIESDPKVSAHGSGRAVDFGLAGGDPTYRKFIQAEAEKRGFKFVDESSKNHYHVQVSQ